MILKKIINRILKCFGLKNITSKQKVVYLTFDDGPEYGITEFVLDELAKYQFKATFFCRGDNAEKNTGLLALICKQGHAVGNHSYSHLRAHEVASDIYIDDVEKADTILHTNLFRPPFGSITIKTWLNLRGKYRMVYWSLNSEDSECENFDFQSSIKKLKSKTKNGYVVLFHFCHFHETKTRQLLPPYLKWLYENGYQSFALI